MNGKTFSIALFDQIKCIRMTFEFTRGENYGQSYLLWNKNAKKRKFGLISFLVT